MLILLGLTLIVANRRTSHAHADAAGRRRIPWFLEGIAAASVRVLDASLLKAAPMARGVTPTMRVRYPMSWMVALLVVLVRLAIAMLYAGALDPALAIQRTGGRDARRGADLVFAAVEPFVQGYPLGWLGLSDDLGGALTGAAVGLVIGPMKRRLSRVGGRVGARLRDGGDSARARGPAGGAGRGLRPGPALDTAAARG